MGTLNAVQKTSGSGREGLEEIHDYWANLEFSSKKHPKLARTCAFPALAYNHPVTAKSVIGIRTPETPRRSAPPLRYWRIFCARILSMVGCARHPKGWPVPWAGSSNLVQSATIIFERGVGGLQSFPRSTA